ncbi:MAG: succinate dehydrogenase cytochrome b subunit [Acidobacteria bacterium]|nr:MAG: succinate dehydrogenase cytochrome b subunit [Acidobacteriota bacterium]
MRALRMLGSSVGNKLLLGLTGLALFGFLLFHLFGNLLGFLGPEIYNEHAHALISNPLIIPAEFGILAIFLTHIYKAVVNYWKNRAARPVAYGVKKWAGGPSRKSVGSTTMIWTGLSVLIFVAIHLKLFKYGPVYFEAGTGVRDLYRLLIDDFRRPGIVAGYVLAMFLLGLHLRHGISSSIQSLGLMPESWTARILRAGIVLAILIAGLFAVIPVAVYFGAIR